FPSRWSTTSQLPPILGSFLDTLLVCSIVKNHFFINSVFVHTSKTFSAGTSNERSMTRVVIDVSAIFDSSFKIEFNTLSSYYTFFISQPPHHRWKNNMLLSQLPERG